MASIFNVVILFVVSAMTSIVTQAQKVRMCYYTSWAQARAGKGRFLASDIDPRVCTHVLFAFADMVVAGETLAPGARRDLETYQQIMDLKSSNPGLQVLLAVGGGKHGTWRFEQVAKSKAKTRRFVQNAIGFLRSHGFDGLDVDWEFPKVYSKLMFQQFLDLLSEGFQAESQTSGKDRLLLTVAVWGNHEQARQIYMPAELARAVDYVLIMAYDLWGTWSNTLGHQSPLYVALPGNSEQGRYSVNKVVEEWRKLGAPYQKLVMGIGSYGRSGVLSSASQHDFGQRWSQQAGPAGPFTATAGFLAFYEICDKLKEDDWTVKHTTPGEAAYAWNSRTLEYICYDDERSVQAKAEYILDKDMAGAMFWTLDYDDFSGTSCSQGSYPLLGTAMAVMEGTNTSDPLTNVTKKPHTTTTTTAATTTSAATSKPPVSVSNKDCGPFQCLTAFGHYSDPADCDYFFQCVHSAAHRKRCPPGLKFDQHALTCNYPAQAKCQTTC